MALPIFVYGTLKRSTRRSPHALMRNAQFVDVASMSGMLYDLGRYPGVYRERSAGNRVFGELYAFPAETTDRSLETLDRHEGPEFTRKRVYVTLRGGRRRAAWTYLLRDHPGKSARPVTSGRYQLKRGAA